MKKHILAIILCVLCASLVFVLASCGDTNTDSGSGECTEHSFGDWTTKTYASCTSAGLKVRVCKNCSYEDEEEIPAGHNFGDWKTVKEVSCEEDGLEERKCSACDFVEPKEIKAEGHDWGDWEVSVPGDCTTKGEEKKVCGNCGADETREIAANGHNWTDWGIGWDNEEYAEDPTCTEEGYLGRVCLDCGDEERDPVPAKGHEWGDWNVAGNCTDGATKTRECIVCQKPETVTTEPGEHANIVFEGAKEATREEDGSTGIKKCLACGETLEYAKIIRIVNVALGSTTKCGSPAGQFWASTDAYTQKMVDGDKETGVCSNPRVTSISDTIIFAAPTNVDRVILVVNGKGSTTEAKTYDEITNNDYTISFTIYNADGKAIYISESYQTVDQIEIEVDVVLPEGELASSMVVKRFKQAYICENYLWEVEVLNTLYLSPCEANGHTWGETTTVEPTCSKEALTDGYTTKTCTTCGEVDKQVLVATHKWTEWNVTNFSCIDGGTMTRSCTSCGKEESQTTEGGEHGEIELKGAKEATLEAEGYTGDKVCKVCGQTTETGVVIPKLVNVAIGGTISTTDEFWAYESKYLVQLNDGNKNTGVGSSTKITTHKLRIDFAESSDLIKLVFVVNSTGSSTALGEFETLTNNSYELYFKLFDAEGNEVYSSSKYQTADQTEIIVELENSINAKYIEIYRYKQEYGSAVNAILWEVEAIAKGKVSE